MLALRAVANWMGSGTGYLREGIQDLFVHRLEPLPVTFICQSRPLWKQLSGFVSWV